MEFVIITGIVIVTVIAFTIILYREQRDKERRKAQGLPAKKYHDITDCDVSNVYTIHQKRCIITVI